MARFRSDQDYPITVNDLGRVVGPREEFDWPGYDPAVHGAVAGCTRLDEPQEAAQDAPAPPPAPAGQGPAQPPPAPATAGVMPKPAPAPDSAASKENEQ